MKQVHKPIETTQFSDLASRLSKAEQMIRVNNASADMLYEQTGQVMPRFDVEQAKRSIQKAYDKFYGYDNKYHAL